MTRDDFVQKAVNAGLSDADIKKAMDERRQSIGSFDDEKPLQSEAEKPAWFDVQGKIKNTIAETNKKIEKEGELSGQGKQSGLFGGAMSMLHAGSGLVRGIGDILSPAVDNPVTRAIIEGAGSVGASRTPDFSNATPQPLPQPIQTAQTYLEQHPEVLNRIGSGVDIASLLPVDMLAAKGAGAVGEGLIKAIPRATKAVVEAEGNPVTPIATAIGNAIQKPMKSINSSLGELAAEHTAVPEDVLRMGGTETGLKTLQQNKNKAYEIGNDLVNTLYNPIDKFPESKTINNALDNIPMVDANPLLQSLSVHIIDNPAPKLAKVNDMLSADIGWISDLAEKNGGFIPAKDMVNVRQQLDELIDDQYGKDAGKYITALKDGRHAIRQSLIDAAQASGNQEYIDGMSTLADKLDLVSKIKSRLGQDQTTGEGRAESFVRNLFNNGKSDLQATLKDFDTAFGTDITNQAYAAKLADNLNKNGELPLLTKWPTGRGGILGPLGSLTVGSPRLMSKMLNLTGKLAGENPVTSIPEKLIPDRLINAPAGYQSLSEKIPGVAQRNLADVLNARQAETNPLDEMGLLTPKEYKALEALNTKSADDVVPNYNPDNLLTPEEYAISQSDMKQNLPALNPMDKEGYDLHQQFFPNVKGEINPTHMTDALRKEITAFAERINSMHDNDLGLWYERYGLKGYPNISDLDGGDIIDIINSAPATKKEFKKR